MTQHRKEEQSNNDYAIALRARELISNVENWCTGYRLNLNGQMCITGAILMALGAIPRDKGETNFDYNEEHCASLTRVTHLLGWDGGWNDAETFNDAQASIANKALGHKKVLERLDRGLLDWANADLTAKYKEEEELV